MGLAVNKLSHRGTTYSKSYGYSDVAEKQRVANAAAPNQSPDIEISLTEALHREPADPNRRNGGLTAGSKSPSA